MYWQVASSPPQRHSALAQVDTAPADLSTSGNPTKIKKIEIPMFFQKKNVRRVLHVFNHFWSKKMVPEDFFRWTFALQALTDFKPSELKGAEEVESSQRLKDVFCWEEMRKEKKWETI